ncbi:MAG TPA: amino acid ABC transporter permease [Solirubrobacterales bacterium]
MPEASFLNDWGHWLPELLPGLWVSIKLTIVSLAFGLPFGVVLALGTSATNRLVRYAALVVVEAGRGTPALVLLYLVYFGLPSDGITLSVFMAGAITLAAGTGAYTSEIFRAGLLAVPRGQYEAARAIGLSYVDQLRLVVLPQAIRICVPPLVGWSIILFQGTSVAYAISLPELTSRAYNIGTITFKFTSVLALAGLMYAAIAIPAAQAVGFLERRHRRLNR